MRKFLISGAVAACIGFAIGAGCVLWLETWPETTPQYGRPG